MKREKSVPHRHAGMIESLEWQRLMGNFDQVYRMPKVQYVGSHRSHIVTQKIVLSGEARRLQGLYVSVEERVQVDFKWLLRKTGEYLGLLATAIDEPPPFIDRSHGIVKITHDVNYCGGYIDGEKIDDIKLRRLLVAGFKTDGTVGGFIIRTIPSEPWIYGAPTAHMDDMRKYALMEGRLDATFCEHAATPEDMEYALVEANNVLQGVIDRNDITPPDWN